MANVRDSDTSLWLHNKLGTSNDSWTASSICSQLTAEVLRNIKDCFPDLQTQVKLKLLLSFFHIPRRYVEEVRSLWHLHRFTRIVGHFAYAHLILICFQGFSSGLSHFVFIIFKCFCGFIPLIFIIPPHFSLCNFVCLLNRTRATSVHIFSL